MTNSHKTTKLQAGRYSYRGFIIIKSAGLWTIYKEKKDIQAGRTLRICKEVIDNHLDDVTQYPLKTLSDSHKIFRIGDDLMTYLSDTFGVQVEYDDTTYYEIDGIDVLDSSNDFPQIIVNLCETHKSFYESTYYKANSYGDTLPNDTEGEKYNGFDIRYQKSNGKFLINAPSKGDTSTGFGYSYDSITGAKKYIDREIKEYLEPYEQYEVSPATLLYKGYVIVRNFRAGFWELWKDNKIVETYDIKRYASDAADRLIKHAAELKEINDTDVDLYIRENGLGDRQIHEYMSLAEFQLLPHYRKELYTKIVINADVEKIQRITALGCRAVRNAKGVVKIKVNRLGSFNIRAASYLNTIEEVKEEIAYQVTQEAV